MNKLMIAVAIVALALGSISFHLFTKKAAPEFALYYQQPRHLAAFELHDHQGKVFNNENLTGQWSWLFLGYTSCPDVCPTTLQEFNFIYDDLQAITDNNQVLMVSVDPKRDSQHKLASYIAYFNHDFKALRAEHDHLFPFTRSLGLMYAIAEQVPDSEEASTNYLVDHSGAMVLVNPQGQLQAIFKPKQALGQVTAIDGEQLVADFAKIVALHAG